MGGVQDIKDCPPGTYFASPLGVCTTHMEMSNCPTGTSPVVATPSPAEGIPIAQPSTEIEDSASDESQIDSPSTEQTSEENKVRIAILSTGIPSDVAQPYKSSESSTTKADISEANKSTDEEQDNKYSYYDDYDYENEKDAPVGKSTVQTRQTEVFATDEFNPRDRRPTIVPDIDTVAKLLPHSSSAQTNTLSYASPANSYSIPTQSYPGSTPQTFVPGNPAYGSSPHPGFQSPSVVQDPYSSYPPSYENGLAPSGQNYINPINSQPSNNFGPRAGSYGPHLPIVPFVPLSTEFQNPVMSDKMGPASSLSPSLEYIPPSPTYPSTAQEYSSPANTRDFSQQHTTFTARESTDPSTIRTPRATPSTGVIRSFESSDPRTIGNGSHGTWISSIERDTDYEDNLDVSSEDDLESSIDRVLEDIEFNPLTDDPSSDEDDVVITYTPSTEAVIDSFEKTSKREDNTQSSDDTAVDEDAERSDYDYPYAYEYNYDDDEGKPADGNDDYAKTTDYNTNDYDGKANDYHDDRAERVTENTENSNKADEEKETSYRPIQGKDGNTSDEVNKVTDDNEDGDGKDSNGGKGIEELDNAALEAAVRNRINELYALGELNGYVNGRTTSTAGPESDAVRLLKEKQKQKTDRTGFGRLNSTPNFVPDTGTDPITGPDGTTEARADATEDQTESEAVVNSRERQEEERPFPRRVSSQERFVRPRGPLRRNWDQQPPLRARQPQLALDQYIQGTATPELKRLLLAPPPSVAPQADSTTLSDEELTLALTELLTQLEEDARAKNGGPVLSEIGLRIGGPVPLTDTRTNVGQVYAPPPQLTSPEGQQRRQYSENSDRPLARQPLRDEQPLRRRVVSEAADRPLRRRVRVDGEGRPLLRRRIPEGGADRPYRRRISEDSDRPLRRRISSEDGERRPLLRRRFSGEDRPLKRRLPVGALRRRRVLSGEDRPLGRRPLSSRRGGVIFVNKDRPVSKGSRENEVLPRRKYGETEYPRRRRVLGSGEFRRPLRRRLPRIQATPSPVTETRPQSIDQIRRGQIQAQIRQQEQLAAAVQSHRSPPSQGTRVPQPVQQRQPAAQAAPRYQAPQSPPQIYPPPPAPNTGYHQAGQRQVVPPQPVIQPFRPAGVMPPLTPDSQGRLPVRVVQGQAPSNQNPYQPQGYQPQSPPQSPPNYQPPGNPNYAQPNRQNPPSRYFP